ncbi:hypothetical protein KSP39_PZI008353 [Platanthera zijinensis]|uniref:Uncharacterized protein n=1 Tax=Platanthera zijinensis TaxID=2320716 RepID=A0AAP0BND7_9ASPA
MLNEKGACCWCAIVDSGSHWNKPTDFPIINPLKSGKRNRFVYACAASGSRKLLPHFPFDSVIKLDCSNDSVDSWQPGSRRFVGEPVFVSKGTTDDDEEDGGYIVVIEVKFKVKLNVSCSAYSFVSYICYLFLEQYAVLKQMCYLVVLDAKRLGHEDAVIVKMEVPPHLRADPPGRMEDAARLHVVWQGCGRDRPRHGKSVNFSQMFTARRRLLSNSLRGKSAVPN